MSFFCSWPRGCTDRVVQEGESCPAHRPPLTLNEWVERDAPGLWTDIMCHLEVYDAPDRATLCRLIFISLRGWAEEKGLNVGIPR